MHDATTTAIGTKHGRLTIIGEAGVKLTKEGRRRGYVICKCDCGNICEISRKVILAKRWLGRSISCGCIRREMHEQSKIKKEARQLEHRKIVEARKVKRLEELEKTKEVRYIRKRLKIRLYGMIRRCYDAKFSHFKSYGGKGIKVCDEWRTDKEAFIKWALENGFRPELEIDRIDSDGDYCPSNCRWITKRENDSRKDHRKRRGATVLEWDGERMTAREWERKLGLKRSVIGWRLRHGFNTHDALFGRVR